MSNQPKESSYAKLLAVDWSKVSNDALKKLALDQVEPIEAMTDQDEKSIYIETKEKVFSRILDNLRKSFPDSLPNTPHPEEKPTPKKKKEGEEKKVENEPTAKGDSEREQGKPEAQEKKKPTKDELEKTKAELEACILALKQYNKDVEASKPAKREKTRYERLLERCLAVLRLAPEEISLDPDYQVKVSRLMEAFIDDLMDLWKMKRNQSDQRQHKKILGGHQEKQAAQIRQDLAKKIRKEMPGLEDLMGIVEVDEAAKKDAAREAKEKLTQGINQYEEDPTGAVKFLKKAFTESQLKKMLPKAYYQQLFAAA